MLTRLEVLDAPDGFEVGLLPRIEPSMLLLRLDGFLLNMIGGKAAFLESLRPVLRSLREELVRKGRLGRAAPSHIGPDGLITARQQKREFVLVVVRE